jgi:hypothetical protein
VNATAGGAGGLVRDAGERLVRRLQQAVGGNPAAPADADPRSRWHKVTINRGAEDVLPDGRLPAPLASMGEAIEVRVDPAPGGKGTELAARVRDAAQSGGDLRPQVRSALREAKQLIEAGEVLRVDPVPHGPRPPTPGGKLVESATRRAGGEGVL